MAKQKVKAEEEIITGVIDQVSKDLKGFKVGEDWYNFNKATDDTLEFNEGTNVVVTFKRWVSPNGEVERNYINMVEEANGKSTSVEDHVKSYDATSQGRGLAVSREENINYQSARKDATYFVVEMAKLKVGAGIIETTKDFPTTKDIKNVLQDFYDMAQTKPEDDIPF